MKQKRKYLLLILPLVIELFACNLRFWMFGIQCREPETSLATSDFYGEGLEQVQAGGNEFLITQTQSGQYYLEFEQIGKDVKSLYLDLAVTGLDYISCKVYAKDEGDSEYYQIPSDGSECVIVPAVAQSKWFPTHFYGNLQSLKVEFAFSEDDVGKHLLVSGISINKPRAMHISWIRICGMELFAVLALLAKKGRGPYGAAVKKHKSRHRVCVGCILLAHILFLVFVFALVRPYTLEKLTKGGNQTQYHKLAVALTQGHVYLDDEVPKWLRTMENPYNTSERNRLVQETGEAYLWDNAYFNGHYYVYFGIVPVLLCYLPYYLAFHASLPNDIVILICSILICAAALRLLGTMVKKWFPSISYHVYLFLAAVFPASTGCVLLLQKPEIYEVPVAMGVMFAILGLDLWLESVQDGEIVSVAKIAAGSLCVALVAGCRPNIFLVFFASFLIFGRFLVRERKLCVQYYGKAFAAFCIPFAVVGIGLMYYNWIRFGSVVDFGASYNLTNNDLTNRGSYIGRIGLGLFEFLWKPFALCVKFPFLRSQAVESAFMGKTVSSWELGGVLTACPFCLASMAVFLWPKRFRQYKQPFYLAVFSVLAAVATAAVTANIAAIFPRYKVDFAYLFAIAGTLAVCMMEGYLAAAAQRAAVRRIFHQVLFLLGIVSILFCFWTAFVPTEYSLWQNNAHEFYKWKYVFEFWQ